MGRDHFDDLQCNDHPYVIPTTLAPQVVVEAVTARCKVHTFHVRVRRRAKLLGPLQHSDDGEIHAGIERDCHGVKLPPQVLNLQTVVTPRQVLNLRTQR